MNKELRIKALETRVTIQIGKNGITPTLIGEIKKQLQQKRLIKIKILKAALEEKDRKQIAKEIAAETKAEQSNLTGLILTLKRR